MAPNLYAGTSPMAHPCAVRSAALAGWTPRAASVSPSKPALNMTVLAFHPGACAYTTRGCTDAAAFNYNALASVKDGSCAPSWLKVPPRPLRGHLSVAHPGLPGGMARPYTARSAALAGWTPRAVPASPP